jgi:hypothetical protein
MMRFLTATPAIALATLAAYAEGKGKRNRQSAPKTEVKAKDKALDEAYKKGAQKHTRIQ